MPTAERRRTDEGETRIEQVGLLDLRVCLVSLDLVISVRGEKYVFCSNCGLTLTVMGRQIVETKWFLLGTTELPVYRYESCQSVCKREVSLARTLACLHFLMYYFIIIVIILFKKCKFNKASLLL